MAEDTNRIVNEMHRCPRCQAIDLTAKGNRMCAPCAFKERKERLTLADATA